MKEHNFLAFDIGATSGRAVVGTLKGSSLNITEIHRYENPILHLHGRLYWDIYHLYSQLLESMRICVRKGIKIDSIGIDTWGVDFGCLGSDGTILSLPRTYRDPHTCGAAEEFFSIIPREKVYDLTGIQVMDFNSLYQLFREAKDDFSPLKNASEILFMPDLLSYMLTGERVCEYTDASTSQILNPRTKEFEKKLLTAAGVPSSILRHVVMPGSMVGVLTDEVDQSTGIGKIPVIAVAGHDTASAVAAVPAQDKNFAYLSSGTWSLMGIETETPIITKDSFRHNFTNEGGIDGTTRFLKNITGMWILEECRRVWAKDNLVYTYPQIVEMAQSTGFSTIINPDDSRFTCPENMPKAISDYCIENGLTAPSSHSEYVRCIFMSLASRYKEVLDILKSMSEHPITRLHVIGGGCKNALLNQMTADAIGIPVIAGPSEATAIGNCMMQARWAGAVHDRWDMRRVIASAIDTVTFLPQQKIN
ncbi:MAG: rhamnulokinase [Flavobacteriales bacterium]|nr:rhamnulokinase [Flavobacteriales bacterium]